MLLPKDSKRRKPIVKSEKEDSSNESVGHEKRRHRTSFVQIGSETSTEELRQQLSDARDYIRDLEDELRIIVMNRNVVLETAAFYRETLDQELLVRTDIEKGLRLKIDTLRDEEEHLRAEIEVLQRKKKTSSAEHSPKSTPDEEDSWLLENVKDTPIQLLRDHFPHHSDDEEKCCDPPLKGLSFRQQVLAHVRNHFTNKLKPESFLLELIGLMHQANEQYRECLKWTIIGLVSHIQKELGFDIEALTAFWSQYKRVLFYLLASPEEYFGLLDVIENECNLKVVQREALLASMVQVEVLSEHIIEKWRRNLTVSSPIDLASNITSMTSLSSLIQSRESLHPDSTTASEKSFESRRRVSFHPDIGEDDAAPLSASTEGSEEEREDLTLYDGENVRINRSD